jgi:hypothetical protein
MLENSASAKFKQTNICIPEESKRKEKKRKSTANDNDKYYMRAAGSRRVKDMKEILKLAAASCT